MSDSYPANFEIAIDREPLTRYLRAQHRRVWFFLTLIAGIFFGCLSSVAYYEKNVSLPWLTILWSAGLRFLIIIVAFQVVGVLGYVLSVRTVATYVNELMLSVEGPFLRVRKRVAGTQQDRRIHFRLIMTYSTKQDAAMQRLGISTLVMDTSVGLGTTRTIDVPGVKDCLKVRDMLSEIDSHREGAESQSSKT